MFALGLLVGLSIGLVAMVLKDERNMDESMKSPVVLDCMGEYWCQLHECSAYECACDWSHQDYLAMVHCED